MKRVKKKNPRIILKNQVNLKRKKLKKKLRNNLKNQVDLKKPKILRKFVIV